MKLPGKTLLLVTLLFAVVNGIIFFNRNNGFEYTRYTTHSRLYPANPGPSFFHKWNRYNQRFSTKELEQGLILLNRYTGIDTVAAEENKVIRIGAWLYKTFQQQVGKPGDSLSGLTPLALYTSLAANKSKLLWCGQFQAMVGFFCTAAGLTNRYVEIVPVGKGSNDGYHEVNEVWLTGIKKWVMTDATRNFLLVSKDNVALSAAEYLDYRLEEKPGSFLITRYNASINGTDTGLYDAPADNYFNKNYALRYYLTTNLAEVYTPVERLKRYILADPWYEMYRPGFRGSSFLFRVKQFFFFGFLLWVLFLAAYWLFSGKRSNEN